eukprot:scaffold32664_cov14-Tisochrysis_lutea.AAC.1
MLACPGMKGKGRACTASLQGEAVNMLRFWRCQPWTSWRRSKFLFLLSVGEICGIGSQQQTFHAACWCGALNRQTYNARLLSLFGAGGL